MNIKQVYRLLKQENISMLYTDDSLAEKKGQSENYYKIIRKDKVWEFLFVKCEKSSDNEEVLNTFTSEEEASKYFYLFILSSDYFWNYIQVFERSNQDINVGTPEFNFKELKEVFLRLNIGEKYYSLNGKIKEHSMVLEEMNKSESRVSFIGKGKKIINSSLILENWLAYYYIFRSAYYLFLLDNKVGNLLKNNEISVSFTDEDYKTFITS